MKWTGAGFLFGLILFFAGCGPGPDPLEWKIDGSDPASLQAWFDKQVPLMPPAMGREFSVCVSNIQLTLPPAKTMEPLEKANHLCARLNGRTVRSILIEGNELSYKMMLARTKNQSDALLRLVNAGDNLTAEQKAELPTLIAEARSRLDESRAQMARGEKRLAELRETVGK